MHVCIVVIIVSHIYSTKDLSISVISAVWLHEAEQ